MTAAKDPSPIKRPSLSRTASSQSAKSAPQSPNPVASKSGAPDSNSAEVSEPSDADIIDWETFNQILELDEDDPEQAFSRETVEDYITQVHSTFDKMDDAYKEKDLPQLSQLGHFLKGSSAQLGVKKVQESCEEMQNVGVLRDEKANKELSEGEALKRIDTILKDVKKEFQEAERWLKKYFKIA